MKLDDFCKVLSDKLETVEGDEKLKFASLSLQQAFKVEEDEVAFFKFNPRMESLSFIWPAKLSKSGTIPLKARDSFAAVTGREKKPQLHNRFVSKIHASIFEQVNLEGQGNVKDKQRIKRARTIQKIMSVPMVKGDALVGVIQVSRKADDVSLAGPDFTDQELEALTEISKVIGLYI